MRSEFEKLSDVKDLFIGISFNVESNSYETNDFVLYGACGFINGAWYAYQEQHKKIDSMKSRIQDIWTSLDDRQSKEHIIESCESIIQELLK